MSLDYTTVTIPKPLAEKVKERLMDDMGYKQTLSSYVCLILRELIASVDSEMSRSDEEKIKARLRKLGYLD